VEFSDLTNQNQKSELKMVGSENEVRKSKFPINKRTLPLTVVGASDEESLFIANRDNSANKFSMGW